MLANTQVASEGYWIAITDLCEMRKLTGFISLWAFLKAFQKQNGAKIDKNGLLIEQFGYVHASKLNSVLTV